MFLMNETTHRMVIRYHPTVGHLFVPNQCARIPSERGAYYVRTNAQGFRSDHDFVPKKGERPRILFFGDSITAGDGCDNPERFSELVGERLGAEVYNYGLSGSGSDQQMLILEELAADVEADLIVMTVFVENIERIKAGFRPAVDRVTRRRVQVPKPYFRLAGDELELHHVPVPLERPEEVSRGYAGAEGRRESNRQLAGVYALADWLRRQPRFERLSRVLQPQNANDFSRIRGLLLRLSRYQPLRDYLDPKSEGCRLMDAILERFFRAAAPTPVLLVPMPSSEFYMDGLDPIYQPFYEAMADPARGIHVADLTRPLLSLPFEQRKRLRFVHDMHLSPFGNEKVAERLCEEIQSRSLLPAVSAAAAPTARPAKPTSPASESKPTYVLGISSFYHNSAAALIRDGEIVSATEEERFTRVKNDRRFPKYATNQVLEAAGIQASDLAAVVYYDNAALTFQRLMASLVELGEDALPSWHQMLPSWVTYKLRIAPLIRRYLGHEVPVFQDDHHRSHAASAFLPSPFERAAILTIDGVGEWATASIGLGEGERVSLLKEMHFPHSLGLLYSAFTQFVGFKVNDGEYKMMGLAPYGRPIYKDLILKELVDLKDDGSIELNLEHFAFLAGESMTNDGFAALFGGPARREEERIGQREMDVARSIQEVTEEAMLRMGHEAHRLTGAKALCLSGGVALNCVANGRLLREGPFEDLWIQPAAGDAGSALGAALDFYHGYLGRPRVQRDDGRPIQLGSHLGTRFEDAEIRAFLETGGHPYEALDPKERPDRIAALLEAGQVVGHFAGPTEFGPRALGARSILGDARNQEMQVNLNLKIKYRESFRPFAPAVLEERVSDYFELDRPAKYMQIVAPVKEERCLPFERDDSTDLLEIVKMRRSDIPAVTHVDYSARIQTVAREDHPEFYDLIAAFERRTGCAVVVNTSFNVRGEPIVNTPFDAYRCFMRTEMDCLVMGNQLLFKEKQPPWPEPKGDLDGVVYQSPEVDPGLRQGLDAVYRESFLPALRALGGADLTERPRLVGAFRSQASLWRDVASAEDPHALFRIPAALQADTLDPAAIARAVVAQWHPGPEVGALAPVVEKLLDAGLRSGIGDELDEIASEDAEKVSETVYAMF